MQEIPESLLARGDTMWSRRKFVLDGALAIGFVGGSSCACLAQSARAPNTLGCFLSDSDVLNIYPQGTETRLYITGNEPMIPKSGDQVFDYALAQTLGKISSTFGVAPGFAYYNDYDALNAYASPTVRLNGADGTVLFGQGLLQRLRQGPESPEVGVAAVCAHEFGHIIQYKHNLFNQVKGNSPTVKRPELQADFFAGYFAGRRKMEKPDFPAAVFAMTQYNFGDDMVNNPNHHGTPDERAAAIVRGFEVAYKEKRQLPDAIQISINYASTL